MAPLVRLPCHVNDDEVRVYWDNTDQGGDLHVWGPRGISRFALSIFTEKRTVLADDLVCNFQARRAGMVKDEPSYLEELEAAGYDPKTLVFSIRKKDRPAPAADVPDDLRKRLEDAQTALQNLRKTIDVREEAKGVYLFSEDEFHGMLDTLGKAQRMIDGAIDMVPSG